MNIRGPFAGTYRQQYEYCSFFPSLINRPYRWSDDAIDTLLEDAGRRLGELNAYSRLIPDVDCFIRMHVLKEATSSTRIEGTRTDVDEAVLSRDRIAPEARDDWEEVQNYIDAMHFAIARLEHLPLSMRLVRETHAHLLAGVRGKYKLPGEVRRSQNWIGGSNLRDAAFIPPHQDDLSELLSDLEKFWHNGALDIPILIKIAITHYQFETIHPFLDGNGRVGRLLIVLQLLDSGYLQKPTLYISDFFERNRAAYFDALAQVRETGFMDQWLKFFLNGLSTTAVQTVGTLERLSALREAYVAQTAQLRGRAEIANQLLRALYATPKMDIREMADALSVSYVTANKLARSLEELDILRETTGQSRNRIYVLHEYLHLFTE